MKVTGDIFDHVERVGNGCIALGGGIGLLVGGICQPAGIPSGWGWAPENTKAVVLRDLADAIEKGRK